MDATEIGDAGAIKVGNMLSRNTSIATICLGANRIGDLGSLPLSQNDVEVAEQRFAGP